MCTVHHVLRSGWSVGVILDACKCTTEHLRLSVMLWFSWGEKRKEDHVHGGIRAVDLLTCFTWSTDVDFTGCCQWRHTSVSMADYVHVKSLSWLQEMRLFYGTLVCMVRYVWKNNNAVNTDLKGFPNQDVIWKYLIYLMRNKEVLKLL